MFVSKYKATLPCCRTLYDGMVSPILNMVLLFGASVHNGACRLFLGCVGTVIISLYKLNWGCKKHFHKHLLNVTRLWCRLTCRDIFQSRVTNKWLTVIYLQAAAIKAIADSG